MTSGKDFFESEEDYRARMSKEADERTIERVTGENPEKKLFEGKEEFRDRLAKEAKESAIKDVTGEKPGKGFLESDGDYRKRITQEANERTIEGIVGEEPRKGFFESESDYATRIDMEAKELIIEEATGAKPSKKFLESEDDYQKRISHRANEARANQGGENILPKSIKDFLGWAAIVFFVLVYSYKAGKWIQEKIDLMWVNIARGLLGRMNSDGMHQTVNWRRTFLTAFVTSPLYRKGIYVSGTLVVLFGIYIGVVAVEKIAPIERGAGVMIGSGATIAKEDVPVPMSPTVQKNTSSVNADHAISPIRSSKTFFKNTNSTMQAEINVSNIKPQLGVLMWIKPEDYAGQISEERSKSMNVVVDRNDSKVMEITSGPAHFSWDKHQQYGSWYQDNSDNTGKWYLLPTKDPKVFEGKLSNSIGEFVAIKLRIN